MSRGGARNRSGPQPDEGSGRSDQRGFKLSALPAEGFDGEVPGFPLPLASDRELALWEWAWSTPQACAWSLEPWRWYTVAEWVRWSVKSEAEDATAATVAAKIRLADQIGLTPAGLKENGWKVAAESPRSLEAVESPVVPVTDIKSRLNRGSA
jgi:hypothetical protein